MGFMDMLNKAVDSISKGIENIDVEKLAKNMSDINREGLETTLLRKATNMTVYDGELPGKYCPTDCDPETEGCEGCQALQAQMEKDMRRLEKMEEYLDSPTETVMNLKKNQITKCTLCGAPIEPGETACPYCDTEYPEDFIDFDIPASKSERKAAFQAFAGEIWKKKAEAMGIAVEGFKKKHSQGSFMGKLISGMSAAGVSQVGQTGSDILQAASHYELSVTEYMEGALKGKYKTYPMILQDKRNEELQKQRAERHARYQEQQAAYREQQAAYREQQEKARERERELQEKIRQQRNESFKRQMDFMASKSVTYYGGGAGLEHCCGRCVYYYGGDKCADGGRGYTSGASDGCSLWKLK